MVCGTHTHSHTHTHAYLYYFFIAIFLAIIAFYSLLAFNFVCVCVRESEWMNGMFWNKIKLVANSSERSHRDRNNWLRATIFHIIKRSSLNMIFFDVRFFWFSFKICAFTTVPFYITCYEFFYWVDCWLRVVVWCDYHWIVIVKMNTHSLTHTQFFNTSTIVLYFSVFVAYDCATCLNSRISNKKPRIIGNDYQ